MEDSTEKSRKQLDDETDLLHSHCPFCLPICDSILQPLVAILRFFGFNGDGACRPTPADCYTGGSDPPSTAVDPPDDEYEQESEYYRRHVPPRPPWSTGGGGQTD